LNITDGLSQSSVTAIFQDKQGFLWIGTQDGLNRYDGYTVVIYKTNPEDPFSISDNWITCITEDTSGNLWIGTAGGGLNKFDKYNERFTKYRTQTDNKNSLSADRIRCLHVDLDNNIWIGTEGGGLNIYDPERDSFDIYLANSSAQGGFSGFTVVSVVEDSKNQVWIGTDNNGLYSYDKTSRKLLNYSENFKSSVNISMDQISILYADFNDMIWIGTENGLFLLDPKSSKLSTIPLQKEIKWEATKIHIISIQRDSENTLWIGTNNGLFIKDINENTFYPHQHNPRDPQSLSENHVLSIIEDVTGIIWIGTNAGGLNKFDRKRSLFVHFKQDISNPNTLSDNNIWSFAEDIDGTIWIGTNRGLNHFDPKKKIFRTYRSDPLTEGGLSHNVVRALWVDHEGNIWCGTDGGGLNLLDRRSKKITIFQHDPENPNTIIDNRIRTLFEDEKNILWIGTWNGLNAYDYKNDLMIHYKHEPLNNNSLSDNRIRSLWQDRKGNLWIGTYGGLNVLDKSTGIFHSHKNDPLKNNSITNDRVLCIYEDTAERLWIGTFQGLNLFDRKNQSFSHFTVKDGLPNDVIYGIVEDEFGMLWLSTNNGLVRYDPGRSQLESFKNFDVNDGLQSNEFNGGAYLKSKRGAIYFGGINGFNQFFPGNVRENTHIPPVVITSFKKFDRSITLPQSILYTREIHLSYRDNFFAFEFAALDFTNPFKNQYAYKLEGFDENWIECANRRYASYTNLDGGEYVFKVRGSNNDGVWNNQGEAIRIIITPPFWKTWWFRILSVLVIIAFGYSYYRFKVGRIEKQRQLLKQEVEKSTTELISINKRLVSAQQKTEKYASQSRLLYEVGQRISKDLDLDVVLNNAVSQARDAFDYFGVMLFLFDHEREGLLLKSIAGGYKDVFAKDLFIKLDEGMIGQAAKSRRIELSNDVRQNKHYIKKADEVTLSELAIPIIGGKELIGVLDVQSDQLNAFNNSDVDAMETFSTQLASAIKNARLYEQAHKEINERRRAEEQLRESRDKLTAAKKETDTIFKNIDEGLFLLNSNTEIGAQYSQSLEVIFDQKNLNGKTLIKILEDKIPANTLSSISEYIKIMFDDSIDDDSLNALNPLNEIELYYNDEGGFFKETRFLMFRFKRIVNRKGKTQNIMVSVRDVTAQKQLARRLEQTEADQKKQIEWMLSILHIEPSLLREFMDGAKSELEHISKLLRNDTNDENYQSLLNHAGRSMHLVKGNASLLELKFFEKKAHQFEDKITELKQLANISGSHFIPLVLQLEDMRNTVKEIDKLIDRLGNIHNQFRPKREFESQMFIKSLQNLVTNLAKDYDKEVILNHDEFDPGLIPYEFRLKVKEILIQLIRNAIYHGIEPLQQRIKINKQPHGTLFLKSFLDNRKLRILFRDDGQGLKLDQLRQKAKQLNQWKSAEIDNWNDNQLAELIFVSGISTAENTDLIAGRGMGMDAVRSRIQRIKGQIHLKFAENEYCEFDIEIPITNNQGSIKTSKVPIHQ